MLLDFISLKDLGKYKLNIQVIQLTGALCTPEIYEKIGDGFRKHGFDEPEVLSAYESTVLGWEFNFTMVKYERPEIEKLKFYHQLEYADTKVNRLLNGCQWAIFDTSIKTVNCISGKESRMK